MTSVNKVILVGNLGADPETRYSASGDAICNIRLATTDKWKDKNSGEQREATEWRRVVFYRKLAEIADQYLKKGSLVYIEGQIKTRKWQDKDGQDRYTTEIQATDMKMIGSRVDESGGQRQPSQHQQQKQKQKQDGSGGNSGFDGLDDSIPF